MTGIGRQESNPFPVNPVRQLHVGERLITRHSALKAHDPGQGSTQRLLIQVSLVEQSELRTHSGRQLGAVPIIFDWHPHWALFDTTWQTEFGPQGVGTQGFVGIGFKVDSSTFGGRIGANRKIETSYSWSKNGIVKIELMIWELASYWVEDDIQSGDRPLIQLDMSKLECDSQLYR